ncbi:PIN domain-containing protein [Sorangium sp. So ce1128]
MKALAVPDTNVLIHFRPFDNLPWDRIVDADDAEVVILWPVVRELDKLKTDPRLRDRARGVLAKIEEAFAQADHIVLQNGMTGRFFHSASMLDVARAHGLETGIGDDLILAEVLALKQTSEDVVLVTDDSGMRLRARAYGIDVRAMPQEYRVMSTDPLQAENAKLRRELDELRAAAPKLTVEYLEGGNSLTIVRMPVMLPSSPRLHDELDLRLLDLNHLPMVYEHERERPTQAEVEAYNEKLQNSFRPEYKKYMAERDAFELFPYISVPLEIVIRNSGGRPADKIKLSLTFPAPLEIVKSTDVPTEPATPVKPPLPGRRRFRTNVLAMDDFSVPMAELVSESSVQAFSLPDFSVPSPYEPSDPEVEVKSDGASEVSFFVGLLSNFEDVRLPMFYARFRDPSSVGSFNFSYVLRSHSLPRLQSGTLHVHWKRSMDETE